MREEEEFYTFFELALLHHDEGEHHSEEASVSLIVAGPSWRGNVCVCVSRQFAISQKCHCLVMLDKQASNPVVACGRLKDVHEQ